MHVAAARKKAQQAEQGGAAAGKQFEIKQEKTGLASLERSDRSILQGAA
jgi:hypothetical protein